MKLRQIAEQVDGSVAHTPLGAGNTGVTGVTHNSAWAKPGDLFVAIRGHASDGHRYIADALARGAAAVAGEGYDGIAGLPVPYLQVADARQALADIAALLYEYPSRKLTTVGVTGTKGKTTTTWLIRHLLQSAGHPTGLLSTLGYKYEDDALHQFPAHFTTPEAPQVQAALAQMVTRGCTHALIEASSEALAQHRLRGTSFEVAVWTNLAPEHLNFHRDMEGYFQAKRILFENNAFAVLNAADPWGMRLADRPHVTYADAPGLSAAWWADRVSEKGGILSFDVHHPNDTFTAAIPIIGRYNVANAMAAIAVAARLGVSIQDIQDGLASFPGVPGRMQILRTDQVRAQQVRVLLDFAHTPESLRNALTSLRQTTERRLAVVIGSAGGPRDPGKRAPLGSIATELADYAIFTEEDCRDTPIYDILNEMKRGAAEAGRGNYVLIPDRRNAIVHALTWAEPGDTVVFCGKAGETTLERAEETLPWDEESIVLDAMAQLGM